VKRLLAFGDSNTYGYDPRSYFGGRYESEDRWVDVLAQITGWEIINAGENGREIPKRSWEFEDFRELCKRSAPLNHVLILLGGNDLLQGTLPEEIALRMETFLRQSELDLEKIVLIGPPAMGLGAWVGEEKFVEASKEIAKKYELLAKRMGVSFIDASSWDIALTFDGVHYAPEGQRSFAHLLVEKLG